MENNLLIFIFSGISLLSAFFMIFDKNPIHSILYLALIFLCVGSIFLIFQVDFIAMLFLVVYLGALVVLFLFVVMMLNVKIIQMREKFIQYIPLGGIIAIAFTLQIIYLITKSFSFSNDNSNILDNESFWIISKTSSESFKNFSSNIFNLTNVESLSQLLYTEYAYFFIISGMILLLAMLGSIVLTLNQEFATKRQDIYLQIGSHVNKAIILRDVS